MSSSLDRPSETHITALEANHAAVTMLLVQALGSGIFMVLFEIGATSATLLTLAINSVLLLTVFRGTFEKLLADARWTTRPDWLTSIVVFILAFWSSRAWAAALIFFYPDANPADTVNLMIASGNTPLVMALMLLTVGVFVPIIEEIAFRGLMLRGHERAAGSFVAALVGSFLFAFAHGALISVISLLPMAYMLSRLVQYSGSFWNAVLVHAFNNLGTMGLALVLSTQLGGLPDMNSSELSEANPLFGAMAFAIGLIPLIFAHLWLRPKVEEDHPKVGGPWFSGVLLLLLLTGAMGLVESLGLIKP